MVFWFDPMNRSISWDAGQGGYGGRKV